MKTHLIILISGLSLFFNLPAKGQGGIWTWISGTNIFNSSGIYGIQGVPSVTNRPPSDYEHIEWKDKQGNLWIYGGTYGGHSDMWKFNPATLEWTWMFGPGTTGQSTIYG